MCPVPSASTKLPQVVLQAVSYQEKFVLRQLVELYQYDFSEFTGEDVNEHGFFEYEYLDHYWTEEGRAAFFVRIGGKLAGFALIRDVLEEDGQMTHSLAEFFILRKYRKLGIGLTAAFALFDRFPGRWKVGQVDENQPAQVFWRKVITEYTNGKFEEIYNPDWGGPIQSFNTLPLSSSMQSEEKA